MTSIRVTGKAGVLVLLFVATIGSATGQQVVSPNNDGFLHSKEELGVKDKAPDAGLSPGNYMPTSAMAYADDRENAGLAQGYGFILLSPEDARNEMICRAFFSTLFRSAANSATKSNGLGASADVSARPTYWLDARSRSQAERSKSLKNSNHRPSPADCPSLVRNYDFRRAWQIKQRLVPLKQPDPVLAAIESGNNKALVYNLSSYRNERQFTQVMSFWRTEVSNDVQVWRRGAIQDAPWMQKLSNFSEEITKIMSYWYKEVRAAPK